MQSSDAIFGRIEQDGPCKIAGIILPTRNCADDQKWFRPIRNRVRQRRIGRFMRQIFTARKKTDHWPANLRYMITHCPAQHRIFRFNRV
jgi:hypothetical protein